MLFRVRLKQVAREFQFVVFEILLVLANRIVGAGFRWQGPARPTKVGVDLLPKLDEFGRCHLVITYHYPAPWAM
jgi:hypothetical protein